MKPEEILNAMEHIDADLIEAADGTVKKRAQPYWIAAVAAMLVLLIGIALMLGDYPGGPVQMGNQPGTSSFYPSSGTSSGPHTDPSSVPTTPPTIPDSFSVPLVDFTKEPEKLTGLQQIGKAAETDSGEVLPGLIFYTHMLVVEARVKEVLPDLYKRASWRTPCYVLVMETLDAMNVDNMPKEFFLLLSSDLCPDLHQFDSLILCLQQEGVENYLLINQSTATYEAFHNMFECFYLEDWGSVIAFRDGKLDNSLWDLPNWFGFSNWDHEFDLIEEGRYWHFFPGGRNSTLEECKEAIRQQINRYEQNQHKKVFSQADFGDFSYLTPFENGVFEHTIFIVDNSISITQTINGIETNEHCYLENGVIKPRYFTKDDLSSLPDLGAILEIISKDINSMIPPFAKEYLDQGYVVANAWAEPEYCKKDETVYGIIKLVWHLENIPDDYAGITISRYFLITPDGICRTDAWDEVDKIKNPWKYEYPYDFHFDSIAQLKQTIAIAKDRPNDFGYFVESENICYWRPVWEPNFPNQDVRLLEKWLQTNIVPCRKDHEDTLMSVDYYPKRFYDKDRLEFFYDINGIRYCFMVCDSPAWNSDGDVIATVQIGSISADLREGSYGNTKGLMAHFYVNDVVISMWIDTTDPSEVDLSGFFLSNIFAIE